MSELSLIGQLGFGTRISIFALYLKIDILALVTFWIPPKELDLLIEKISTSEKES